jgi:hypothetical protein
MGESTTRHDSGIEHRDPAAEPVPGEPDHEVLAQDYLLEKARQHEASAKAAENFGDAPVEAEHRRRAQTLRSRAARIQRIGKPLPGGVPVPAADA